MANPTFWQDGKYTNFIFSCDICSELKLRLFFTEHTEKNTAAYALAQLFKVSRN